MAETSNKTERATQAGIVRKAIIVAIFVFFFAVALFVGFVILAAKFAAKTTGSSGS